PFPSRGRNASRPHDASQAIRRRPLPRSRVGTRSCRRAHRRCTAFALRFAAQHAKPVNIRYDGSNGAQGLRVSARGGLRLETMLYLPVKRFLERLGFEVKGEIDGCDLVAIRGGEPPVVVIGELKLSFTLELVLQGVDRAAACDEVWLAV